MLDGGQHSFVQGYKAQIAVDGDSQVIVAAVVTQTPEDRQQLVPMVEAVKQTAGHKPKTVAADAGYWSTAAVEQVRKKNIRALVPPERTQHSTATHNRAKTEAAERMRKVLSRKPGRMAYAHRQGCVEPVFGILKEFRGYRRFHLRGLENVNGEWALMCLGHNLRKLCAHRARTAA
jgi:IS5 family transposase